MYRQAQSLRSDSARPSRQRLLWAGLLLGIGLGGLFDGIVMHQVLQWHHLFSEHVPPNTVENLELNTLADGVFHAATWIVTVAGILTLWASDGARHHAGGTRCLVGATLVGWGSFNTVEGIVDHHVLNLHHVRPGPDEFLYDLAFLAWGVAMAIVGTWLIRSTDRSRRKHPLVR